MAITYNRRFFIYVLISLVIFTLIIVPAYNKYVTAPTIENFEDPQKMDEVISRLELIANKLEKILPEKALVVETPVVEVEVDEKEAKDVKIEKTEKYADNEEDDEEEEEEVRENFTSPKKKIPKMSNVQGYDSYLYDSYYMNLN